MAEYQARFLMLDRICPSIFLLEREKAAHFLFGLCISLRVVVATFSCATLVKVVMMALE